MLWPMVATGPSPSVISRRANAYSTVNSAGCTIAVSINAFELSLTGKDRRSKVVAEARREQFGASVDLPPEDGPRDIQLAAHVGVLRALAREHKHWMPCGAVVDATDDALWVE